MKFTNIFGVLVTLIVILFVAVPVNACEEPCRVGVSKAFVDNWKTEILPIFKIFSVNSTFDLYNNTLLNNVTTDVKLLGKVLSDIYEHTQQSISGLSDIFIPTLPAIIEDAIFNVEPRFKGDCNNPKRVTQPQPGVNWTLQDCANMDYICGNPPSICHFLDVAKNKSKNAIVNALTTLSSATGTFLTTVVDEVKAVASGNGLPSSGTDYLVTMVTTNLQHWFNILPATFESAFCPNSCPQYDQDIKLLLLSYP
ncbi:7612_t:CDS:1 [Acaulospora morrowiae]|uniref:7612_t:CDS:1 n=1 Tax=Acaulospora morrowiae TaxID=94023 RepID=A0A9N8VV32_9GLOM|nr:7612_t:CDS:1 [Acaulospora morrowiae]